jgi:hypothetical protein
MKQRDNRQGRDCPLRRSRQIAWVEVIVRPPVTLALMASLCILAFAWRTA